MLSSSTPSAIGVTFNDFSALTRFALNVDLDFYTPSTFSFQNALRPLAGQSPLYANIWNDTQDFDAAYLFTDACPSNGKQNCTESCRDPAQAFSNLTTFHNCASYPLIAQFYEEGNISATTTDGTTLDTLGFLKVRQGSDVMNDITNILTDCLKSYCNSSDCQRQVQQPPSNVFNSPDAFFNFFGNETTWDGSGYPTPFEFADNICRYQRAGLNPDVGGIGVFISYWIQSGIALLGSVFVVWWSWGVYLLCFLTYSLRNGPKAGKEYAKKISAKYGNRHLPSTIAALVDFQKAQCFFMLAINIGAQLYNNFGLIQATSVGGYLPITFTLLTLRTVGMVSWYLIILAVSTVTFSIATSVSIGKFQPSSADMQYLQKQFLLNGTAECGNRNLLVYCLTPPWSYYSNYPIDAGSYNISLDSSVFEGYSTMSFCIVVLVLLILDQTGLIKKMRNMQLRLTSTKNFKIIIANFMNIRGLQLLLTILLWVPSIASLSELIKAAVIQICLLYIYLTSNLHYQPRKIRAGKLFNNWVVLASDVCSWAITLSYIRLTSEYGPDGERNVLPIMGTALAGLLWLTFSLSLVLTSAHIHRTRKNRPKKHKLPSQYSASRRRFERVLSPIMEMFRSITSLFSFIVLVSRINRFKGSIKTLVGAEEWTTNIIEFTISLIYIIFHAIYIYWFVAYAKYLGTFYDSVDKDSWSFGQVVAITVWAQPICEYFYLEIRGMTRGFQHRLMWPYKVVRQDEDIETGHQLPQSASRPPPPPNSTDGADQPKRASYELVTRASSQAVPYKPHPVEEDVSTVSSESLNKDPEPMKTPDDLEAVSMLEQERHRGYGRPRSGSEFSWEQEQGAERDLELEHPTPRRSYLRIPQPEGGEIDSFQGQQQEELQELEHAQEQEHSYEHDHDHEPYWRIPESVLLKPNDLRLE